MRKHFTATAFVVRGDTTLLHWHRRLAQWMPPGGHVEPDEEPVEAALREVREETGLVCEVVATSPTHAFAEPQQLPAPYTILLENIPDSQEPAHMHIDLIYFVRPVGGADHSTVDDPSLTWVTEAELRDDVTLDPGLPGSPPTGVPEDVRTLALAAIAAVHSRSA